jgi:hypothetical protein
VDAAHDRPWPVRGHLPRTDHRAHVVGDLLVHAPARLQTFRTQAQDLDEQGAHQQRVAGHASQVGADRTFHLLLPVVGRIDGLPQHLQRVAAGGFVEGDEALGLVAEVLVEGAARHAGLAHDVGDGRVGVALLRHRLRHATQQPPAVLLRG